ncbi:MAG TPA: sterol desaturase family protein, partial [Acidimicrobiales bacterium]
MADLTVVAIPAYFGGMGAEYLYLKNRAADGGPRPTDYERQDTIASLAMGTASLFAPLVASKVLGPITPGKGKFGKALVATALGAVAVTTIADVLARTDGGHLPEAGVVPEPHADPNEAPTGPGRDRRRQLVRWAKKVQGSAGLAAVVAGGTAVTTSWARKTAGRRLWEKRVGRDKGTGPLAVATAILAWDAIYYWNHRFMHESRFLWAIHVVHHSSERYNLSTALRQPVADAFGTFIPYGVLSYLGIRPDVIETARGVNLLYQFWIHTDAIGKLGPFEEVFNTASHHRVHHGSNRQYLDRNHGSILI